MGATEKVKSLGFVVSSVISDICADSCIFHFSSIFAHFRSFCAYGTAAQYHSGSCSTNLDFQEGRQPCGTLYQA
jgi:hypothetical protein